MCGIAGVVSIRGTPVESPGQKLGVISRLVAHRGPDGHNAWISPNEQAGLAHRRLAIIDLSDTAQQPMVGSARPHLISTAKSTITSSCAEHWPADWRFRSKSDTETILAAYDRMATTASSICAACSPSRCGTSGEAVCFAPATASASSRSTTRSSATCFVFASEAKALLPFLPEIETDPAALAEYLTFQYTIGETTLFRGVKQLLPGPLRWPSRTARCGVWRYWDVRYEIDFDTAHAISSAASPSCSTTPSRCTCAAMCRSAPMFRAASIPA